MCYLPGLILKHILRILFKWNHRVMTTFLPNTGPKTYSSMMYRLLWNGVKFWLFRFGWAPNIRIQYEGISLIFHTFLDQKYKQNPKNQNNKRKPQNKQKTPSSPEDLCKQILYQYIFFSNTEILHSLRWNSSLEIR